MSFNSVYGKIGRCASEEVVINLLNVKCLSALLYGMEACPVMSRHKSSLDFAVTRLFMKILRTGSAQIVTECQKFYNFLPVSYRIDVRTVRFLDRFISSENYLCAVFCDHAQRGINDILAKYNIQAGSAWPVLQNVILEKFFTVS